MDGLTHIEEVNEHFGLNLHDDYYDTIAGLVMGRLGRPPKVGDCVAVESVDLKVEALDGRRISQLSVFPHPPADSTSARRPLLRLPSRALRLGPMFAEVVVNLPNLNSTFHYSIPDALRDTLAAGHLVTVPFGARRAQGLVVGLTDTASVPVADIKAIEGLIDVEPVLTAAQLELARWLAHTPGAAHRVPRLMLPPGLSKRSDALYSLTTLNFEPASAGQQALVRLLQTRGPLRGRQIDRALPRQNWHSSADTLVRRGVLTRQSVLDPPAVHAKQVRTARIAAPFAQIEAAKPNLSRSAAKAARLAKVLDFLVDELEPVDLSWVYAETGANWQDVKELADRGWWTWARRKSGAIHSPGRSLCRWTRRT